MIALGIDPSTTKLAVAGLHDNGLVTHGIYNVPPGMTGAHRLRHIREILVQQLAGWRDVAVVVVEIPWANPKNGSNFALLGSAAVALEAAQRAHHGAVVLDLPTQSWKRDTVGNGNASKAECMAHALGLGLDIEDQDLADALCMAQAGWVRWHHATTAAA